MRSRSLQILLATAALLAFAVAVSTAATPSSGKVDKSNPSVTWEGTLAESFSMYNIFNNNPNAPCIPVACDTFALEVADGPANLELVVNLGRTGSSGDASAGIRITRPDGSREFVGGPSGPEKGFKHVIKNAPNGKYVLDVVDTFAGTPGTYKARATLLIPGAATTGDSGPATTPSNPPPTGDQGGQEPGPASPVEPSPKLTIKAPKKASAKKLSRSRKLPVALETTGPLTKLTAVLRKGKANVAKGKLAKLDRRGKLTLKFAKKKLKKGSYKLTVQGLDSQNRTVTETATVKVAK